MSTPHHVCRGCGCLLHIDDTRCLECDMIRPPRGWRHVSESGDAFLGRVLNDRYVLSRRIGVGASGSVYRAESLQIPRRFAAKVLQINEAQSLVRFQREVAALAQLRNPHVVPCFEILELGDDWIALIMDLVEGQTLRDLVETEGPVPWATAVDIARQLANGVFEAHQRGLIHRDLKPENLMVEKLPAGGYFLRILDFGIVWAKGDAHVTQGFIGTPLFCSPEQAMGSEIDERSDIYSAGAILYYMVAGQPPFPGNSTMRVLQDHVTKPAPSLFETTHGRLVPDGYQALVASMLAKDPLDRPLTMAEVVHALDQIPLTTSVAQSLQEPTLSSCEECEAAKVLHFNNRPGSDVACMANIPLRIACHAGHLVASTTQSTLAVVDGDRALRWFSLTLRAEQGDPTPLPAEVGGIGMSKERVWLGLVDGSLLALKPTAPLELVHTFEAPVRSISVDRHETCLAVVNDQGVYLRHLQTWARLDVQDADVVEVSRAGDQLAVVRGTEVTIRNTTTPEKVHTRIQATEPVISIAFSNDGYVLAVALESGDVLLESPDTGREIMALSHLGHKVRQVAFSPGNILMALCTDETNAYILDLQCRHAPTCSIEHTQCERHHDAQHS